MLKKDKCTTDNCGNRKAYSIVFEDGARGKYCDECTSYMNASKTNFFGVKTVKLLEIKKEVLS